jgi:tetratricopeptide (TPR) repeat protein
MRTIPYIFLSLFLFGVRPSFAQNINDDTVFLNTDFSYGLKFKSKKLKYELLPKDATDYFSIGISGGNLITIDMRLPSSTPAHLHINDDDRVHSFVLVYKKEASSDEAYQDWSNLKYLALHVKEIEQNRKQKPENTATTKSQPVAEAPPPIKEEKPTPVKNSEPRNNAEYYKLLDAGTEFQRQGNYAASKAKLEQALAINPDSGAARLLLDDVSKKLADQQRLARLENDRKYNDLTAKAATAYQQKNFTLAKDNYTQALSFVTDDPQRTAFLMQKISDLDYQRAVAKADGSYNSENYKLAQSQYQDVLSLRPNDSYAQQRLQLIGKKISDLEELVKLKQKDKELRAQFDNTVQAGDHDFNAHEYASAKSHYEEAQLLFKDDTHVKEQLIKIKNIQLKYATAMDNGARALAKQDLSAAKNYYTQASELMPLEVEPKQKLTDVESLRIQSIADKQARDDATAEAARLADLDKRYTAAFAKAKKFLALNDYENARAAYSEAATIKPGESEPQNQISSIDDILRSIAKAREHERQLNLLLDRADSLFKQAYTIRDTVIAKGSFLQAKAEYANYINQSPENARYAITKIHLIDSTLNTREQELVEARYNAAMSRVNKAQKERNWADGVTALQEALRIKPGDKLAMEMLPRYEGQLARESGKKEPAQNPVANTVKNKAEDEKPIEATVPPVNSVPEKPKPVDSTDQTLTLTETKVVSASPASDKTSQKVFRGEKVQKNPLAYSLEDLKLKYPNIDFQDYPAEQKFNQAGTVNQNYLRDVMNEKPNLQLQAEAYDIKLTCQNIKFIGSDLYIKFLIENNSDKDFLTGPVMLTWQKAFGQGTPMKPMRGLGTFPVVAPDKQVAFIYVARAYMMIPEDNDLLFEMTDRDKRIKLQITIPGKTYNQEQSR